MKGALVCAFCLLMGSSLWAESVLRVRPHVVVAPNSDVKLAQLVDGQGLSAELQRGIAAVSLSVAPSDGEKQEIASANITSVLRPLIQRERARGGNVRLIVPKTVVIDTLKHELEANQVRAELMQAWQPLCADCRLEIEALSLPRVAGLRDWTLRLKSELPRGSFSLPIDLIREDGQLTPAWVSGRLAIKRKVPVAKRILNIGERVLPQDFAWEYRDTSFAIDGVPLAEELTGKRMKQGLRANEILWGSMLEKERAVHRGDLVQLRSSEGAWEVTVNAIAQQDAFVGDVINLKNPKTNAVLMGQVTGPDEVELR